jgi:hypothetical protein
LFKDTYSKIFPAFVGLILLSCVSYTRVPSFEDWYRERETTPHAVFLLTDSSNGCEVYGAKIRFVGIDSVFTSYGGGECRVYGHMGRTWTVHISRERFLPIDTTIALKDVVSDTIAIRMVRTSQDSLLHEPVTCAYRSGWENAERAIQENDAYIYLRGGLRREFLDVDTATGLPLRGNETCIVTDYISDFSSGHNDRVRLQIADHGLPINSKKQWISVITRPEAYFDSARKQQVISDLFRDSLAQVSPDSTFQVWLRSYTVKEKNYAEIRISSRLSGKVLVERIFDEKRFTKVQVAWGPAESKLVVVRTPKLYFVFDLVHCEMLNSVWH